MKREKVLSVIIKIIIVLIIIMLLLLIVIQVFNLRYKSKTIYVNEMDNGIYVNLNASETIKENVLTPINSYLFLAKYNGSVSNVKFYTKLYDIAYSYIPNYFSQLKGYDLYEIKKFYLQNKDDIAMKFGISSESEFVNLMTGINKLQGESLKLQSFKFDKETIRQEGNTVNANLCIEYEYNAEFDINITLLEKEDSSIIIVKYTQ